MVVQKREMMANRAVLGGAAGDGASDKIGVGRPRDACRMWIVERRVPVVGLERLWEEWEIHAWKRRSRWIERVLIHEEYKIQSRTSRDMQRGLRGVGGR